MKQLTLRNCIPTVGKPVLYAFPTRKSIFIFLSSIFLYQYSSAQISSSNPGLFGIDGDLYTDTVMNGTFTVAGSHDWFFRTGGTGISVFDTVGTAAAYSSISQGSNYNMLKKMQYPRYSVQGGMMFMDATYSRDDVVGNTISDYTAFTGGASSINDPTTWATTPGGSSVQAKTDIVDAFVHMRRLNNSNSHLIAYVGGSSLGTTGNRYFDFEFYRSRIAYNSSTGLFSNSGPSSTGGHTAFTFNIDGSIKSYGDLTLSFSFSSSTVSSIDIYIWVDNFTYSWITPKGFDFDKSTSGWFGSSSVSNYGYAHIIQKTGGSLALWGMVNTVVTTATPWGSNSKDIGTGKSNFTVNYATGQFAEAAIDLTSFGIDPMIGATSNPCSPPYTRVLVKSRASSSFSSSLADFVTPMEFLDAPMTSSAIAVPSGLSCSQTSTVLQPATINSSTQYVWSTTNGSISTRSDSTYAVVTKGGQYYLQSSYPGCNNYSIDSVTVTQDTSKPVATAGYTGVLTTNPASYVTLKGGDTTASNYSTPFGGSKGLLWNWSGPNSFSSALQNPTTTTSGTYQLTVTEKRNGCTATATTTVLPATTPLAQKYISLTGSYEQQLHVMQLKWSKVSDLNPLYFEVQKSINNKDFAILCSVKAEDALDTYSFTDASAANGNTYRIKAVFSNSILYSNIFYLDDHFADIGHLERIQNPVNDALYINYYSVTNGSLALHIYTTKGEKVASISQELKKGNNNLIIPLSGSLNKGVYLVEMIQNDQRISRQILKL